MNDDTTTESSDDAESRARRLLAAHHGGHAADGAFAARVLERLPARATDPFEVLGWATLRLLPAALLIAAGLGWASVQAPPGPITWIAPALGDDALTVFVVSAELVSAEAEP